MSQNISDSVPSQKALYSNKIIFRWFQCIGNAHKSFPCCRFDGEHRLEDRLTYLKNSNSFDRRMNILGSAFLIQRHISPLLPINLYNTAKN